MTKKKDDHEFQWIGAGIFIIGMCLSIIFFVWGAFVLGEFIASYVGLWLTLAIMGVIMMTLGGMIFEIGEKRQKKRGKKREHKKTIQAKEM